MGGGAQHEHKPACSQGRQAEPERLSLSRCARPRRATAPRTSTPTARKGRLVPIYGHNMSDGGVFSDFAKYSDESFARGHSRIDLFSMMAARTEYGHRRRRGGCEIRNHVPSSAMRKRLRNRSRRATLSCANTTAKARYSRSRPALSGGQFPSHRVCGAESMR